MEERFYSVLILHALGDTIGFKNGDWEFNYDDMSKLEVLDYVNELIYEFIELGGVNGIDLKGWHVSDDTFLHLAIGRSMLKFKQKINEPFILDIKRNIQEEAIRMQNEKEGKYKSKKNEIDSNNVNRYMGVTTQKEIMKFSKEYDARFGKYNSFSGGNGAAMRSLVIGLCLHDEKHRELMTDLSIISSQITHNNANGYLAGFTAALFTALAINNIPIKKWVYILLDYLKSDTLKKYLSLDNLDQIHDHNMYIRHWQKYIDTKFDGKKEPIRNRSYANPMHRIRYFHDNFHKDGISYQIGGSGFLCMIMAYDAVLDCDGKWEKLIVYAILHSGDSDTIGAVAGGLYGAVYGMGDVPLYMLDNLERKKEIEKMARDIYKKYWK